MDNLSSLQKSNVKLNKQKKIAMTLIRQIFTFVKLTYTESLTLFIMYNN